MPQKFKEMKKQNERAAGRMIIIVIAAFIGVLAIVLTMPGLVINLM